MSTCYRQSGNTISILGGFKPCSNYQSTTGFMPCCSSGHTCLEDGFCYNSSPSTGQTGYYMAVCTDASYKDASCPKQCLDLTKGDVVYNNTTNLWNCCGQTDNSDANSAVSCNNPTSESFEDPSPQQLQAGVSATTSSKASTSSSTSSTSSTSNSALTTTSNTSTASSSSSATNASSLSDSANQSFSTGAKAGTAIGAVLGVAIILGLIFFFLRRSKRARRNEHEPMIETKQGYATPPKRLDTSYQHAVEMDAPNEPQMENAPAYEKYNHSSGVLHELGDNTR